MVAYRARRRGGGGDGEQYEDCDHHGGDRGPEIGVSGHVCSSARPATMARRAVGDESADTRSGQGSPRMYGEPGRVDTIDMSRRATWSIGIALVVLTAVALTVTWGGRA